MIGFDVTEEVSDGVKVLTFKKHTEIVMESELSYNSQNCGPSPNTSLGLIIDASSSAPEVQSTSDDVIENDSLSRLDQSNPIDEGIVTSTPHLNPEWLKNLCKNMYSIVVEPCSKKVRHSVENNVKFDKPKEKREVRLEIIHSVLDHIQMIFGGVGRPKLSDMKEIKAELGCLYPAVFKDDECAGGYGLGGKKGLDSLPSQMLDMLRGREGSRKKDDGENGTKKVGKRKWIYGVDNDKWYKDANSADAVAKLAKLSKSMSYEEREVVFESCRKELMHTFRNSRKLIASVCPPFFCDPRHLEKFFQFLTNTSLTKAIEDNFIKQIGKSRLLIGIKSFTF